MLNYERGGLCKIKVEDLQKSSRRYVPGTNILESQVQTSGGVLVNTDFMPWQSSAAPTGDGHRLGCNCIVRLFRCERGTVKVEVLVRPTKGFALGTPELKMRGGSDIFFECELNEGIYVHAINGQVTAKDGSIYISKELTAGQEFSVVLDYAADGEPHSCSLPQVHEWLDNTTRFWQQWSSQCRYKGEYFEAVLRSALTLKLLVFEPSGALLAAPTTSLPERIGGSVNWDYSITWLRVSTL